MTQANEKNKLNPFDNTLMDDLSMYDKMPYTSNHDLCNSNTVGIQSGNLLKSYRVKESEPYIIKQHEERFRITPPENKPIEDIQEPNSFSYDEEELSKEQLDSLLKDNEVSSDEQESVIETSTP